MQAITTPVPIKLSFDKLNIDFKKEIVAYSAIIFIVAVADKLYWQTDQILLGIIESPNEVAIYAVAIQFINIFMSLSIAINSVFLPRITKLFIIWLLVLFKPAQF